MEQVNILDQYWPAVVIALVLIVPIIWSLRR